MFRAMAMKELRETVPIVLMALGACLFLFSGLSQSFFDLDFTNSSNDWRSYVPFVDDESFYIRFCWVGGLVAIALGFRQSLGESIFGTYPFLFHRPAGRRWVVGMKLVVGLGLYLMCGASVILTYGFWAATPGRYAGPFEWSMTLTAWAVLSEMTLLYLGTFLCGIRPGRWYGSRLLPLAAIGLLLLVVFPDLLPLGTILQFTIVLAVDVWLIVAILFVAQTRDYH